MISFWILGAVGLAILIEFLCIERAAKHAYEIGYAAGKEQGRLEGEVWWLEQGTEVQRVREKMWMEEQ